MCPLRIILIFLSASLAGFLAWKSFSSKEDEMDDLGNHNDENGDASHKSRPLAQACNKVSLGFWTLVDMASGQYLWRNLVGNKNKDVKAS
ncbi:hypothetical protein SUGI_0010840 [Cryptomeria japonica]|uniref:uncharacterized protein LOC131041984 n=1 Tax=Cryptomeria japonica TaxID=3369 RepID=UPI002408DE19|nr:uncharacterized protein LOC131041984 [Cryptomeria japonica]GLJ05096.1 hypothetical protein SUGI_0010840 [Cryptomeria japonica]